MDRDAAAVEFDRERPRLERIAGRILQDAAEAQDAVQQAWLRMDGTDLDIRNLPAWLTTVTTRICLDRLRQRLPEPLADLGHESRPHRPVTVTGGVGDAIADPAEHLALADTVGIALQVVLDRLTPAERVAFVLHDSFAVEFATIAEILGTTPAAARKLASRARTKVAAPVVADRQPDWVVVDAFLAAARQGEFGRLLELLAPDAVVAGDEAAVALGTPARVAGRQAVATMFDGAAKAALPMTVQGRAGAAWVHRGEVRVAFDFTVRDGQVVRIDFRADPAVLADVRPRRGPGD